MRAFLSIVELLMYGKAVYELFNMHMTNYLIFFFVGLAISVVKRIFKV